MSITTSTKKVSVRLFASENKVWFLTAWRPLRPLDFGGLNPTSCQCQRKSAVIHDDLPLLHHVVSIFKSFASITGQVCLGRQKSIFCGYLEDNTPDRFRVPQLTVLLIATSFQIRLLHIDQGRISQILHQSRELAADEQLR
jgi:hypothetical protein